MYYFGWYEPSSPSTIELHAADDCISSEWSLPRSHPLPSDFSYNIIFFAVTMEYVRQGITLVCFQPAKDDFKSAFLLMKSPNVDKSCPKMISLEK